MADAQGSSAEVSFNGTGIVWVADKAAEFGIADVFVDGKRVETVNLAVTNLPRLRGVEIFRTESLSKGDHTISIVSGSGGAITVDSFIVYGPAALNKS
jgi:hypothetical protein